MTDTKRDDQIASKLSFSDWTWDDIADLSAPISESAARLVIAELIKNGAFVTWKRDKISVQIGPLSVKFNKGDLLAPPQALQEKLTDGETIDWLYGAAEISLSGDWQSDTEG